METMAEMGVGNGQDAQLPSPRLADGMPGGRPKLGRL